MARGMSIGKSAGKSGAKGASSTKKQKGGKSNGLSDKKPTNPRVKYYGSGRGK